MDSDSHMPNEKLDKRVDWAGAALVTAAMVCIMFVLGQGSLAPQKWRTPCESRYLVNVLWSRLILFFGRQHRPPHCRRLSPRRFHHLGRPPRETDKIPAFDASGYLETCTRQVYCDPDYRISRVELVHVVDTVGAVVLPDVQGMWGVEFQVNLEG